MTRPFTTMALLAALAAPYSAMAQEACIARPAPRIALTGELVRCCAEKHIRTEVLSDGAALEFWGNRRSGTWTTIKTSPRGLSCITASGHGWRPVRGTET